MNAPSRPRKSRRFRKRWPSIALAVLATFLTPSPANADGPLSLQDLAPAYRVPGVAAAAARTAAGDWTGAREALLALASGGRLPEQPLRLRFLLGLSCLKAGDPLGAATVLEGLDADIPLMADRILWMRGTALVALGRTGEAVDALARVPEGSPVAAQARDVRIDALVASGRLSEAADLLRKAATDAGGDAGLAGRLAGVLRQAGDADGAEKVLKEAFGRATAAGRRALRGMLGSPGSPPPAASESDALDVARDLLDAQRSEEAVRAAAPLLDSKDPAIRCEARLVRAAALTKLRRHPEALADYRGALKECADRGDTARVLFNATRSAYRAGEMAEGDGYAARLSSEFPTASFNDDVSIMRARQAIGRGDTAAAERILEASVKAWPGGDMADESRWLLAWAAWAAGDRERTIARCREGRAAPGVDPDHGSRFAYWEARALQKAGRRKEADATYAACVREYPMTFYAVLAAHRLAALRKAVPDALVKTLSAGTARPGPFFTPSDPLSLTEGPAARILWLSQTGLPDLAREEAVAAADRQADAGWLAAMLLDAGGMYTRSHRVAATLLKGMGAFWPDARTAGYYRLGWPRPYRDAVERAARESSIDPLLIWALMRQESAFVAGVESRANAIGLMQLILPTARSMAKVLRLEATPETLRRPEINIRLGAAYLSRLIRDLHDPILAIPGYNAGGRAIQRKLSEMPGASLDEVVESIGASETREYARKVFENWSVYRWLYAGGDERLPHVRLERGKGSGTPKKAAPAVRPPKSGKVPRAIAPPKPSPPPRRR